ncbi:hypothetical protein DACRYDRAFT_97693 [Dacryopinax primogenitus]|uniref:Uncharacterized protein n=1 Tax=Dacryopinax primogenitus (strain DJM 731) TaxID=1858805 RepID=M5G777_DACPD|nr:uncharacterized protein DACRYDRAFT_97693 [Dacryopinax primogenitus]EJU06091.1 hypothetical protein DACRYDRAFT_97693 [Dacryopinax primogenitus]
MNPSDRQGITFYNFNNNTLLSTSKCAYSCLKAAGKHPKLMFSVRHALGRASVGVGHARRYPAVARRPHTLPSFSVPFLYPANRHASTQAAFSGDSEVVTDPERPPPRSDLQGFIAVLSAADSLTPAAVSRTSARVIRSCLNNDNLAEAVIILSALRAANERRAAKGNTTLFPLRLASTTLVHGLLQQNNIHQAARLARDVMPVREHLFRAKTIDVVVKALCPKLYPGEVGGRAMSERLVQKRRNAWITQGWSLKPLPPAGSPESLAPVQWPMSTSIRSSFPQGFSAPRLNPEILRTTRAEVSQISNAPSSEQSYWAELCKLSQTEHNQWTEKRDLPERGKGLDASTRMAIALLAQARRTKQSRTNEMYKRVVDACLFQGELVTATVLFGILLYDLRRQHLRTQAPPADDNPESVLNTPAGQEAVRRFEFDPRELYLAETQANKLYQRFRARIGACAELPDGDQYADTWEMMRSIVWEADDFDHRNSADADQTRAILATMWIVWGFPFNGLSLLIKSLYSVSRTSTPWPPRDRKGVGGIVHDFCHAALAREIVRLNALGSDYRTDPTKQQLLDPRSYNALLHYALRHRLSPKMAEGILQHMQHQRQPPREPDQATHTILLRSASLLHQNNAAQKILERFAAARNEQIVSSLAQLDSMLPVNRPKVFHPRLAVKVPTEAEAAVPLPNLPLVDFSNVDAHVINTIIAHYVSTGRADLLLKMLSLFLPTMQPGSLTPEGQIAALHRMVLLGPDVFTSLLNACMKMGMSGIAERVWRFALRAERSSWTNGPWGEARHGWVLGIESYTIMMQLYAIENENGLAKIREARNDYEQAKKDLKLHATGWGTELPNPPFGPYQHVTFYSDVQGTKERWLAARLQGLKLFRTMRYGGIRLVRRIAGLTRQRPTPDKLAWDPQAARRWREHPHPDARFFNACLALFGREDVSSRYVSSWNKRHFWERRFPKLIQRNRLGRVVQQDDTALMHVISWMRQLQFPVPLAFAFLRSAQDDAPHGFQPPQLTEAHLRNRLTVRPYAYPDEKPNFHAFRIHVQKDRGLPIRRQPPRKRGDGPARALHNLNERGRSDMRVEPRVTEGQMAVFMAPSSRSGDSTEAGLFAVGGKNNDLKGSAAVPVTKHTIEKTGKKKKQWHPCKAPPRMWHPRGVKQKRPDVADTTEEREPSDETGDKVAAVAHSVPSRWDVAAAHCRNMCMSRSRKVDHTQIEEKEERTLDDALPFALAM